MPRCRWRSAADRGSTISKRDEHRNGEHRGGVNAERFSVTQTTGKSASAPPSRIVSAISFGFSAASPFDQRDHPVQERVAFLGSDPNDDPVAEDARAPVTALRSPPLSRMTGADSPVMARFIDTGDPFDHVAIRRITSPASHTTRSPFCNSAAGTRSFALVAQAPRHGVLPGLSQGVGLRLATAFRHRLGEIRKQDREPEPEGELRDKSSLGWEVRMPTWSAPRRPWSRT